MKTTTKTGPVAKPGVKMFLDLGLSPKEAKRLNAASNKLMNDTYKLRKQLMVELTKWIREHDLKQADAAQILLVSRPRISDLVNMKTPNFTIDTLVGMMSLIGKPVKLAVA